MHGLDLRLRLGVVRLLGMRLRLGCQVLRVRHVLRLRLRVRLRGGLQALRLRLRRVCRLPQACETCGNVRCTSTTRRAQGRAVTFHLMCTRYQRAALSHQARTSGGLHP